jgi:hypothetical protein
MLLVSKNDVAMQLHRIDAKNSIDLLHPSCLPDLLEFITKTNSDLLTSFLDFDRRVKVESSVALERHANSVRIASATASIAIGRLGA